MRRSRVPGWSSAERYEDGGAVRFEQRARPEHPVVDLTEEGARTLGAEYWREVESFTHRLVRVGEQDSRRELRLLGRWTLLGFGTPEVIVAESGAMSRFPITGGVLARTATGSITFAQVVQPGVELSVTVEGFVPRFDGRDGSPFLPGMLYRHVQRRLHAGISHSYFARLISEAAR